MEIQKGWVEQRKHERVTTALSVSYRVLDQHEMLEALDHPHYHQTRAEQIPELSKRFHVFHAITQDISLGGMALHGDHAFTPGDKVEIFLQLPKFKSQLTLLTQVIRIGTLRQGGKTLHTAGVQILAIHQEDVKKLNNFLLSEKLHQQKGK